MPGRSRQRRPRGEPFPLLLKEGIKGWLAGERVASSCSNLVRPPAATIGHPVRGDRPSANHPLIPSLERRGKPCLVLLLIALGTTLAAPPILNPNAAEFPDAGLLDHAAPLPLTDFLRVDGQGHFIDGGGQRVRFWGINVASESVFQPFDRIDTCIERIRRAGFNLVRIHHIDGTARGIVTGTPDSLTFEADKLKALDYWIHKLGQAGIAVYLDLLDYRAFVPGDGIAKANELGRAAKPYAVFDEGLIDHQQRYAKALLRDHVNSFNGRCYADDPTIVLLELFDENGLFIRRKDWPELVEPYRAQLRELWNDWLRSTYGTTAALRAAWAGSGVAEPLQPAESIERRTVRLPNLELGPDEPAGSAEGRLYRARSSDAQRFAYALHRRYYQRMRDYLRDSLGVRVPLTAVGDSEVVPDLLAVAEELDFVGCNYYWDHPIFRAGQAWQMPFLFHFRNPLKSLDETTFPAQVALAKMARRPLVVREWNPCFPNPHRAAGMVEATTYACLQDLDAMILFTYGAVPTHRQVGYFDVHQDPARWGLAASLGEIYRTGAIAPAKYRVELAYSGTDTFLAKSYRTPLRTLAQVSGLANRCFGAELIATADLTVASGRSAAATYRGGPLLLSRNDPSGDLAGSPRVTTPNLLGYPVPLRQGPSGSYRFDGQLLFPAGERERGAGGRFRAAELGHASPVGTMAGWALGFYDPIRKTAGFGPLSGVAQARAATDLLRLAHGAKVGSGMFDNRRLVSDTGEIVRDANAGRLTVGSPRALAVAGELPDSIKLGGLRVTSASDHGAVVMVSLDGQPLEQSTKFVARFVTDARNTAMQMSPPGPQNNPRDLWELTDDGHAPILTGGRSVSAGYRVYVGDTLLFAIGLAGGTAEVVREGETWSWFVDTPGIWVRVPGAETAQATMMDGTLKSLGGREAWQFPEGAALVTAR